MDDDKQDNQVSSVSKLFKILEALSEQKATGVSELAVKTNMSKATTYRFLQTMKTLGCVAQDDDIDKYSLTLNLLEMGSKAISHPTLLSAADEEMRRLGKLTGEAVHLAFATTSVLSIFTRLNLITALVCVRELVKGTRFTPRRLVKC